MFVVLLWCFFLFGIPAILFTLFCVYLNRYRYAKKLNKTFPDKFSDTEVKKFKTLAIVFGVTAFTFIAIVIYLIYTLTMAVAYM